MTPANRYVLFYCDDCDLLLPAINVFRVVHPLIDIHTSSDLTDLLEKINVHKPEMILVYLHDPEKDYMSLVKAIRKSTSAIPIVIYKVLPDEHELKSVFNKIAGAKS